MSAALDYGLRDRAAIVTGAGTGIGEAVARTLAASGASVLIADVHAPSARAVAESIGAGGGRAVPWEVDVTDPAAVDAAFTAIEAELGPVEVLIANAGVTDDTLIMRMSEEQFSRVVETNLGGAWRVAKRSATKMVRARWGRMIFISSVVGLLGSAGQVNYAASKAGLVGMARSIARELGSRSITANVVAPGFVETEMTAVLPEETQAAYRAQIPLQRYAGVEEVAGVVRWIASDEAGYVTGAVIPVDGGLGMGH